MEEQKLHLLWSPAWSDQLPALALPEGFSLAGLRRENYGDWQRLMIESGFFANPDLEARQMFEENWHEAVWLGIFDDRTGSLVAADFERASNNPIYPDAVELFYISVLPEYRGRKLAKHLTRGHMVRAKENGLSNIFVETDDFRLASICNCLNLGFRPCLYAPEMWERWKTISQMIGRPFTPDTWPLCGEGADRGG